MISTKIGKLLKDKWITWVMRWKQSQIRKIFLICEPYINAIKWHKCIPVVLINNVYVHHDMKQKIN